MKTVATWESGGVVSLVSFREKARMLDACVTWLEELGYRIEPTRVGHYRRVIMDLAEAYEEDRIVEFLQHRTPEECDEAFLEATQLILIWQGFCLRQLRTVPAMFSLSCFLPPC
jgi:hypothetical protein